MMERLSERQRYLLWIVGLTLLYALLTRAVMSLFMLDHKLLVVWPPGWLSFALLLMFGKRYWPGIFLGSLASEFMVTGSPSIALCMAVGNTAGILLGVSLLGRIPHFNLMLASLRDYFWLGIAAATAGCTEALISTVALVAAGPIQHPAFAHDLLLWAERNTLSIILATPIILAWQCLPKGWFERDRIVETLACFGLAVLTGQVVFLGWASGFLGNYAKAFLMFVFIIWSAVRFGRHGVFLVIVVTGLQALLGAKFGIGFFADDIERTGLTNLWFYIMVLTDVGLAVDFVTYELRRSEQRERTRNQVLELIARDTPLVRVLQTIVASVEKENEDLLCCILLKDKTEQSVFTGAISSTADCNCQVVQRVTVDIPIQSNIDVKAHTAVDVRQHPFLIQYRNQAELQALRSCRIEPIRGQSGALLGEVALYRRNNLPQTNDELRLIAQIANLASIAIDQHRINEELQLALMVYQNSSEAMIVTDADANILTVNPAFTDLTGYTPEEAIGKNPRMLSSGHQSRDFYQSMWDALKNEKRWQGEIWNRRKNGDLYVERLSVNTILNSDDTVHRYVALFSDITQKKASEELIWKQANFDQLTGLPNRSMLLDRLRLGIRKSHRTDGSLALLFLDLDRFKEVNDTLGHGVGDILLREAALRLTACIRESDTLARWGGDEFVIMLDAVEPNSVERVAQSILQSIAQPFKLGVEDVYVSASIGISFYPSDAMDIDSLLKTADQAMYTAKRQGRNRYSYFTSSMQEAAQTRMRLMSDLYSALENNQFELYYQPIVELATGTINKAEALIRWRHPGKGLVSPAEFIPIAEETGLIRSIGSWVFHEATRQVAAWRKLGNPDFQISINKSPIQFQNVTPDHADWHAHLSAMGLPGDSVVVEITEGVLLENNADIVAKLLRLREAGIGISLDDFGTGYSSLSYLQKFDINYLKIDRCFVQGLAPNSNNLALCEAMIIMAHRLGIAVVAEGIESELQRTLLLNAGCDYGQGFLFSPPLPAADFAGLIQTKALNYN